MGAAMNLFYWVFTLEAKSPLTQSNCSLLLPFHIVYGQQHRYNLLCCQEKNLNLTELFTWRFYYLYRDNGATFL